MDLYRCDNDPSFCWESNQDRRWRDTLSDLSMYIESLRWLGDELDQNSVAWLNECWRRNLPVEACDEWHSLLNDFHRWIFVYNRSSEREITFSDWSCVAMLVWPLLHKHLLNSKTTTKTLPSGLIDPRNREKDFSQSMMILCLSNLLCRSRSIEETKYELYQRQWSEVDWIDHRADKDNVQMNRYWCVIPLTLKRTWTIDQQTSHMSLCQVHMGRIADIEYEWISWRCNGAHFLASSLQIHGYRFLCH